jgi:hypothetical protein
MQSLIRLRTQTDKWPQDGFSISKSLQQDIQQEKNKLNVIKDLYTVPKTARSLSVING